MSARKRLATSPFRYQRAYSHGSARLRQCPTARPGPWCANGPDDHLLHREAQRAPGCLPIQRCLELQQVLSGRLGYRRNRNAVELHGMATDRTSDPPARRSFATDHTGRPADHRARRGWSTTLGSGPRVSETAHGFHPCCPCGPWRVRLKQTLYRRTRSEHGLHARRGRVPERDRHDKAAGSPLLIHILRDVPLVPTARLPSCTARA
jgi:hypothetical protein